MEGEEERKRGGGKRQDEVIITNALLIRCRVWAAGMAKPLAYRQVESGKLDSNSNRARSGPRIHTRFLRNKPWFSRKNN